MFKYLDSTTLRKPVAGEIGKITRLGSRVHTGEYGLLKEHRCFFDEL